MLPSGFLSAQPDTLVFSRAPKQQRIGAYFEMRVDSSCSLSLAEAQSAQGYAPLDSFAFPLPLEHCLWARATFANATSDSVDFFFTGGSSDSMAVYLLQADGVTEILAGNYVPIDARNLPHGWGDGVRIQLAPAAVVAVYVTLRERETRGPVFAPEVDDYWKAVATTYTEILWISLMVAVFLGGVLLTMLYNLIVAISLRSRAYLYYSFYLFAILFTVYLAFGKDLLPSLGFSQMEWNYTMQAVGLNLLLLSYLLFGRSFVNSAQRTPRWDIVLRVFVGIHLAFLGLILVEPLAGVGWFQWVAGINGIFYVGEVLIMLVYGIRLARERSTVVWFFVLGSALVFAGGFGPVLLNALFNVLPDNGPFFLGALTLEIIVFSLGLGYKVRQQQNQKLAAEKALNDELQKVNTAFGRFVPHSFLQSLGHESVLDVNLGDQIEKEVSVLFSDIRGYTTLAEGMTPQDNFNFLNTYLGRMGPIIQAHNGFVNQYYGDGIMALFLESPTDAVAAALAMQAELRRYNEERRSKGRQALEIGIGIHTGPLIMGIIGDTLRLEAGVVSDTVNTAARMEGLTKHFGVPLIFSEATRAGLVQAKGVGLRCLGKVQVKGRVQPLEIWEAFSELETADSVVKARLSQAFALALQAYFEQDFDRAYQQWLQVAHYHPEDVPTQLYLQRVQPLRAQPPAPGWDGVERMMVK